MFDIDSPMMGDAIRRSESYKIVKSGPMIYVFSASTDFDSLEPGQTLVYWMSKAEIVIDGQGNVLTNRFGAKTERKLVH